jgi:uncharacterized protein (UPF0305 family)
MDGCMEGPRKMSAVESESCRRLLAVEMRLDNLEGSVHTAVTELKDMVARLHELEVADSAIGTQVKIAVDSIAKHVVDSKKFQRWMFVVAAYLTLVATDPIHQAILRFLKA